MPVHPAETATASGLIDARLLPLPLTDRFHTWQADPLDAGQFATFLSDRQIHVSEADIDRLWQVGLLRADIVCSRSKLRRAGLKYRLSDRQGWHWYADHRRFSTSKALQLLSSPSRPAKTARIVLAFHPFRYYVVHRLCRGLHPPIALAQALFGPEGYARMTGEWLDHLRRWFLSPRLHESLERWNNIAGLAIVLEPVFYERLFGVFRSPADVAPHAQRKAIDRHWRALRTRIRELDLSVVDEIRRELCFEADRLDENSDVHVLLRLADANLRERLRDRIGGALLLLTMSEVIRRAAEELHHVTLSEEDALVGSRGVRENAKKILFGSTHLLDNEFAAREFLRHHDLHRGVRLRWYVEGETEAAMIRHLLELAGAAGIEVVNLRGQFVQKSTLAFQESLREDTRSGVFSFISLDGDRSDNLRVVRTAAQQDLICGRVFVSSPDVELANFDRMELADVLWSMRDHGAPDALRSKLDEAIMQCDSGKTLLARARHAMHPYLDAVDKGDVWGRRLGGLAAERVDRPDDTARPIVEAVRTALAFLQRQLHEWTRRTYLIDPETLQPTKRPLGGGG